MMVVDIHAHMMPGSLVEALKGRRSDLLAYQVGAGRAPLGTNYPFGIGDADGVDRIRDTHGLSADEKTAILGGSAMQLLDRLDTLRRGSV